MKIETHSKTEGDLKHTEGVTAKLVKMVPKLPHHDLVNLHRVTGEELAQRAEQERKNRPLHEMSNREFNQHVQELTGHEGVV